jgi:hypothetical protein
LHTTLTTYQQNYSSTLKGFIDWYLTPTLQVLQLYRGILLGNTCCTIIRIVTYSTV